MSIVGTPSGNNSEVDNTSVSCIKTFKILSNWKCKVLPLTTASFAFLSPNLILPASINKLLVLIFTDELDERFIVFCPLNITLSSLEFKTTLSAFKMTWDLL